MEQIHVLGPIPLQPHSKREGVLLLLCGIVLVLRGLEGAKKRIALQSGDNILHRECGVNGV